MEKWKTLAHVAREKKMRKSEIDACLTCEREECDNCRDPYENRKDYHREYYRTHKKEKKDEDSD